MQWVCQLSVVSGKNAGAATVVNLLRIGLSCRGACRLPLARPYTRGNCKSSQQPRGWNRYEGRLHSHGSVVKIVQGRARCQVSHNETSSRERWRHRRPYRSQQTLQATGTKPAHPTGMVSPCPSSGPLAFDTRVRVGSGSLDSESRPHFTESRLHFRSLQLGRGRAVDNVQKAGYCTGGEFRENHCTLSLRDHLWIPLVPSYHSGRTLQRLCARLLLLRLPPHTSAAVRRPRRHHRSCSAAAHAKLKRREPVGRMW